MSRSAITLIATLACALAAQAATPDRRQVPAPVVSTSSMATQDQLLDLLRQIENQQTQIKQLQDQLEVQTHELNQLKARQRDTYNDVDRRLQQLEKRGANDPAPSSNTAERAAPIAAVAEQQAYDVAFNALKQKQYDRAEKGFRDFVGRYPQSALADHAQYWLAESLYAKEDYKAASTEFSRVIQLYPTSSKLPDAMLKIGYIQADTNQADQARKNFQEIVKRFPNSSAARLAQKRLDGSAR